MNTKENILIVAGEDSGDTLGASIIAAMPRKKSYHFWGTGGPKMQQEGVELLYDTNFLSVVGFIEVVSQYRKLRKALHRLIAEAKKRHIKWAIMVDYPGFNLRLAKQLNSMGIKCILVVSPQIWAWNYKRIFIINEIFETVLCLYKFEIEVYRQENKTALFMGHPLAAQVRSAQRKLREKKNPLLKNKSMAAHKRSKMKTIALLPGSRKNEARELLPFYLEIARAFHEKHPGTRFLIPIANEKVSNIAAGFSFPEYITLVEGQLHEVLHLCDAAIACSGTVTLECALFGLPYLLVYRSNSISFFIGTRILKIRWLGLLNYMNNKTVIKEFLQDDLTVANVVPELERLSFDAEYRRAIKVYMKKAGEETGNGDAGKKAARFIARLFAEESVAELSSSG